MLDWFENIKGLLEIDAAKRNLLFGYLLFIGAIWYLYDKNNILEARVEDAIARERDSVKFEREICNEQLITNTKKYQEQFTDFTIETNDKIAKMQLKELTKAKGYAARLNRINDELDRLKHENNN